MILLRVLFTVAGAVMQIGSRRKTTAMQCNWQRVEKLSGECKTRQNLAKKRSLHAVNEHFEPDFNAVWCQLKVFQQAARETIGI
ncbi:MAG: hypothetical protein R3F41_13790 [Gammaproteobacteria bacterium]|nr:hypothetical protein [Pseudomonadales bacterium]